MLLAVAAPSIIQLKILTLKLTAQEKLKRAHLKIVYIGAANICWIQKGREARIGNRLFDVEKFTVDKDGLLLTGMYDDEESGLEMEMNKLWKHHNSKQAPELLKYFQFVAVECRPQSFLMEARFLQPLALYTARNNFYDKDIFIKIPYPPPQQPGHILFI